jgi:catechol 2,3-dioxygenase-like lactoylglutathione lyase family enzyme
METSGLNHMIMTIKEVDISRAFYGDLLGFELEKIADGFFLGQEELPSFSFLPATPFPMTASMNSGSAWTIYPLPRQVKLRYRHWLRVCWLQGWKRKVWKPTILAIGMLHFVTLITSSWSIGCRNNNFLAWSRS